MGNQNEIKPRDVYNSYANLLRTFGFRAYVGPATEGDQSGYQTSLLHKTPSRRDIEIESKPRGLIWEELSKVLPPLKSALGPITVQRFSQEGIQTSAYILRRRGVKNSHGEVVNPQTLLELNRLADQIAANRGAGKAQSKTR